MSALIPYLTHIRSRLMLSASDDEPRRPAPGDGSGSGEMDLATLVDTALLKAYINVHALL